METRKPPEDRSRPRKGKEGLGNYTRVLAAGAITVGALGVAYGPKAYNFLSSKVNGEIGTLYPSAPKGVTGSKLEATDSTLSAEESTYNNVVIDLSKPGGKGHIVSGTIFINPMTGEQVNGSAKAQGVSNMLTFNVDGIGLVGAYIQNTTTNGKATTIQAIGNPTDFTQNNEGVQFVPLDPQLIAKEGLKVDEVASQPDGLFIDTTRNITVDLSAPASPDSN